MTAIAIFVKTPGLSPLKTRLAEHIGQQRATEIYRKCAATVAEASRQAAIGQVHWATAEARDRLKNCWQDLPLIEQGNGGLGERMHRVLAEMVARHGSGLLLGADAPQLDPAVLRRADEWLARDVPSRVVGPASDGGFWTFGANHVPPIERWTRPAYSHPDTLQMFVDAMGTDAEWLHLPTLTDLDREEDMEGVAAELRSLPCPLPSQLALMEALRGRARETLKSRRRSGLHPRRTT